MDDSQIHDRISELVASEHQLRDAMQRGEISSDEERGRLRAIEESPDQCWDLLRQRRARMHAGEDSDDAEPRPVSEVESYRQ